MEEYLFNGEKSAVLLLDDVRVGDVVDYAYTLSGDNSVFASKFADSVTVQLSEPVERISTRLLWPTQRHLYIKNHGTIAPPVVVRRGNAFEYKWDFKEISRTALRRFSADLV